MDDVSNASSLATSTPEDAAANISTAKLFSVDPGYVAQNKTVFDQKADETDHSTLAEKPVADYMNQSSEHAALVDKDVDKLSFGAQQARVISDYVLNRPSLQNRIEDLTLKKMNQGGKLSPDDDVALRTAKADMQDSQRLQDQNQNQNSPILTAPEWVIGKGAELGNSLVRAARASLFNDDGTMSTGNLFGKLLLGTPYQFFVRQPYNSLTAAAYDSLGQIQNPDGTPKNLDEDTKVALAKGIGVVGVTAQIAAQTAVAATMGAAAPWVRSAMNPALMTGIFATPARAAALVALGNAVKGTAAMSAGSAAVEVARVVGEEMAKNSGTSEAGFWNSVMTAANKVNAQRVGEAAKEGAAVGALLEVPLQAYSYGATRNLFQNILDQRSGGIPQPPPERDVTPPTQKQLPNPDAPINTSQPIDLSPQDPPPVQAIKSLQLNEALHNINDVQNSTRMSDIAPAELDDVNHKSFVAAGMEKLYAPFEALDNWASSNEKVNALRRLLSLNDQQDAKIGDYVGVRSADVLKLQRDYPDIADHFTYSPEMMNGMEAKNYVEALNRAEATRSKLMTDLNISPEDIPESKDLDKMQQSKSLVDLTRAAFDAQDLLTRKADLKTKEGSEDKIAEIDRQLADLSEKVKKHLGMNPEGTVLMHGTPEEAENAELRYGQGPTFTEAIEKVLPKEKVQAFKDAQMKSRVVYSDMVHDAAIHEMNQVVDQTKAIAMEEDRRHALESITANPDYRAIDHFNSLRTPKLKGQRSRSIYAVAPDTLPKDLKEYRDSAQLKAHEFFHKKGIPAEDAAAALGFNDVRSMLETFDTTPTREQVVEARAKLYGDDIEKLAREHVDIDHTTIMKNFNDRILAHWQEMEFLKNAEWKSVKFGIKTIALPLPKVEDLEARAQRAVDNLRVADLNPRKFVATERGAQKVAVDAILENDVEKAFEEKEKATIATMIQKNILRTNALINRGQKFVRKLSESTAQEIIKNSSKVKRDALNELLDAFDLDPRKKNSSEANSYNKYVRQMVEKGFGDFSIMDDYCELKQNFNELNSKQALVVFDRVQSLFNEMKMEHELYQVEKQLEKMNTIAERQAKIEMMAKMHPDYSDKNLEPANEGKGPWKGFLDSMKGARMFLENIESAVRFYDQGQLGGEFNRMLVEPLWRAQDVEDHWNQKTLLEMKAIKDVHPDLQAWDRTKIYVPEFKGYKDLGYGHLSKSQLVKAWMYKGDPNAREHLQHNFLDNAGNGVALETWQKLFDRHLTPQDVSAAQYLVDTFRKYHEPTRVLHMDTMGRDVGFVKGISNEHQGKFYPGGYVPLDYITDYRDLSTRKEIKILEGKDVTAIGEDDGSRYGKQRANEMTDMGRTVERTGSKKPLDLSLSKVFNAHLEVAHDLAYRKTLINELKTLRDTKNRENFIKMGGVGRYETVLDYVRQLGANKDTMSSNFFSDPNRAFMKLQRGAFNNVASSLLGFSARTMLVQLHESAMSALNAGPHAMESFVRTLNYMVTNPHRIAAMYRLAAEIDPAIDKSLARAKDEEVTSIRDVVPKDSNLTGRIGGAWQWFKDIGHMPMVMFDVLDKVLNAHVLYDMFQRGHIPEWPKERVNALGDEERHEQAKMVARQNSRLSLIHSDQMSKTPLEQNPVAYMGTRFMSFFSKVYGTMVNQARQQKWNAKGAYENFKSGNTRSGFENVSNMTRALMYMFAISTIGKLYVDKLYGRQTPLDTEHENKDEAFDDWSKYITFAPWELFEESVPYLNTIKRAADVPDLRIGNNFVIHDKNAQLIDSKIMSDLATSKDLITHATETGNVRDALFYLTHLNNHDTKSLLSGAGDLTGAPINAYVQAARWAKTPLNEPTDLPKNVFTSLKENLTNFKKTPLAKEAPDEVKNAVNHLEKIVSPAAAEIPDKTTETMKAAIAAADPSKTNGIYGFSRTQWSQIKSEAPGLGLTDAGRTGDVQQQEKAANYYLHDASIRFAQKGIPIDHETLLGALTLGTKQYEKVEDEPDKTDLTKVVDQHVLNQHPELATIENVGQLNQYFKNQVIKAKASLKLTEPPAK